MKKRIFSAYDIIFLLGAITIFVCAVFASPVHSIADQGDFERVMRQCGLNFPSEYSFFDFAIRFYEMKFTSADLLLYLPRLLLIIPATTFIFPTFLTRLICLPFGAFDIRVLSVVMFSWYTAVCFFIQRKCKIKNPILRCLFVILFLFIFFNGLNLTIFNSLYGQSVMLASFATVTLFGLNLFDNVTEAKKHTVILFTISACMLLQAKLQCVVFVPVFVFILLYTAHKSKKVRLCIICTAVLLWNGIGGYIINGGQLNTDTQYNSVFYGILKNSDNPKQDLADMGLDENLSSDSGKHAYLDKSEYTFPPRSDIATEKFHSKMNNAKLIKFYITHPKRLVEAMEETANNSFSNKINLGTFEEKYGFEPGKSSYRLEMWEYVRNLMPKTLFFIIPCYALFLIFGFVLMRKKNKYAIPFISAIIMGLLQFPMPYIGNGAADISKQLFLFNLSFDLAVTVFVYTGFKYLDKKYAN